MPSSSWGRRRTGHRRGVVDWRQLAAGAALFGGLAVALGLWGYVTVPHLARQEPVARVSLPPEVRQMAGSLGDTGGSIPVLTYHAIGLGHGVYNVSGSAFTAQMKALHLAGFHTVSLRTVQALAMGRHPRLPSKPILITFDDGYSSTYRIADPVLAHYHFRAAVFLITGAIRPGVVPSVMLNEAQVRRLYASGRWEVGGHTHAQHFEAAVPGGLGAALANRTLRPGLGRLETFAQWRRRVERDLTRSQHRLEELTGSRAYAFAFPYGAYGQASDDPRIAGALQRILRRHGYRVAFGAGDSSHLPKGMTQVPVQPGQNVMRLPRVGIDSREGMMAMLRRVRALLPDPIPSDPVATAWMAREGTCRPAGPQAMWVTAAPFARCETELATWGWRDYAWQAKVPPSGCTVVLGVRDEHTAYVDGRLEAALGRSRVVVRRIEKDRVEPLASRRIPAHDDGPVTMRVSVTGRRLFVKVGEHGYGPFPASVVAGGPTVSAACPKAETLLLRHVQLRPLRSGWNTAHRLRRPPSLSAPQEGVSP